MVIFGTATIIWQGGANRPPPLSDFASLNQTYATTQLEGKNKAEADRAVPILRRAGIPIDRAEAHQIVEPTAATENTARTGIRSAWVIL